MRFSDIKTVGQLKAFLERNCAGSYDASYFSRENMRYFGDTMRNFGMRRLVDGTLEVYRRKSVKWGFKDSVYWRAINDGTQCERAYPDLEKE